jgi:hypothetical protein
VKIHGNKFLSHLIIFFFFFIKILNKLKINKIYKNK